MITRFYKIYNIHNKVVYVGVTTRNINVRFNEHLKNKKLNDKNYYIKEFYQIKHKDIYTLKDFYKERKIVSDLEKRFIKEEKDNGSLLLNISIGGQWGECILNRLKEKEFFNKHKNYDEFKKYIHERQIFFGWFNHWINHRSTNKTKKWLNTIIKHKSEAKLSIWLYNWYLHKKETNKTKIWLNNMCNKRMYTKTKNWLYHFSIRYNKSILYKWFHHWCNINSTNKTKRWLRNFVSNKNSLKNWFSHWISHRIEKIIK